MKNFDWAAFCFWLGGLIIGWSVASIALRNSVCG